MSLNSILTSDEAATAASPTHATPDTAAAGVPAAPQRDLSVLAWLAPSLRTALDDAAAELGHYVDEIRQTPEALGARDTTSLRLAGQHLHQAAGAVHIVGLRGVDAYCQALRRLLEAIDAGTVAADAATLAVFRTGVQALAEYVDDLMAGDAEDPLRLFQPYAAAAGLMKEERVHPADLWLEDLQALPGIVLPTRSASAVTRARQRFEAALLKALRLPTPCTEASLLREAWLPLQSALDDVRNHEQDARRTTDTPDRGIWHTLAMVFRALAHGLLPSDLLAKRFAARTHLLVRQYLQGQVRVPQALLNDAIFLLVSTGLTPDGPEDSTPPVVQAAVQVLRVDIARSLQAYRVDAAHVVARADYRQRYYGWLDPIDTRNLQHAAHAIERAATDDQSGWELALASLAEAAMPLVQPALQQCLTAAAAYAGQRPTGDALGRGGVALFLSRALAMPWRVHGKSGHASAAEFAERCETLAACLADAGAAAPAWLAELMQSAGAQAQRTEAVAQVRAQLDSGESWLDTYDRNAARADAGNALDDAAQAFGALLASIERIHGSAALPEGSDDETDAALASVRTVLERLGVLRETTDPDARIGQLSDIAAELGAVHAFADLLEFGRKQNDAAADDPYAPRTQRHDAVPQGALGAARAAAMDAIRVAATADSPEIQRLRAALQAVTDQAAIDDDAALRRQASEATTQLHAWLAGSESAAERMVVALADPLPVAAAVATVTTLPTAAPMPSDAAAIDAELLEIFLAEAEEVLGNIATDLAGGLDALRDADVLSRMRRAFHTLKGSSRMVGLNRYGEAAWAVEQVMNLWIAEAREPVPDLPALLHQAHDLLREWALALQADPSTLREIAPLVDAAQALREPGGAAGGTAGAEPFDAIDSLDALLAQASAPRASVDTRLSSAEPVDLSGGIDITESGAGADAGADAGGFADNTDTAEAPPAEDNVLPFRLSGGLADEDEGYKVIGPVRIGLALYNVYLQEADDLLRQFATDLSEWRHENHPCPSELALRVAHTLQGSASTVGLEPVREIAEALEHLLLLLGRHPVVMHPADFRLLDMAVDRLRAMLHQFAAGIWPDADASLCRDLNDFGERALVRPRAALPSAQSTGQEGSVSQLFGQNQTASQALPEIDADAQAPQAELPPVKLTPITSLPPVSAPSGPVLTPVTPLTPVQDAVVISLPTAPRHDSIAVAHVGPDSPDTRDLAPEDTSTDASALDPALVEIFLEEAHGALPDLGKQVRTWEASPDDAQHGGLILRGLHTLKGSARMAGAMALGQAAHEMETLLEASVRGQRVTPDLFGKLYAWYDRILAHVDALQNGRLLPVDDADVVNGLVAAPAALEASAVVSDTSAPATPQHAIVPAAPLMAAAPAALPTDAERQRALVRVQARALDTLINDAGEVSATRARLDSELEALRSYLGELNDNVARLRMQLREIEIQAETQMASRIADQQHNQEFDPLEFDRFTRFQELTRMMAESVNDVATVEQNLQRGFDRASGDLAAQARLTRGLQRGLMQARMVQFDALAERLYRVARQSATETGKEVRLLIKGGTVEIDRSVLDRMAGPIEHLIRNAVVHGIEPADARRAAGKSATGALTLEVQQEGNEVVLTFFDDGGGLNLPRIRERAVARQLMAPDEEASDARLTEMIFAPGFTTADAVSELAGRGVGMDVVRAETVALGGRITLSTEAGRGTSFTVHLPLTTAITQVLLVSLGGRLFAMPSGMIDQVHQLREKPLLEAYNAGRFSAAGIEVPFFYFGALLEENAAMASSRKYSPVVVVRSGAERVAVHVDDVLGNREVVVKHIGPHLARMEGIAGATTLGDGEIVLIYNPVVLAQRWVRERGATAPATPVLAAPRHAGQTGAVAEFVDAGTAVPVPGLMTQPTVMVVDDSLTVRKASQRLLTRAGYQVVLARDGVDALRQLQEVLPDAMLVDIEMPNMDGFDLTRNVRADARTSHMPLVMITSRTAEKHRRYAAEIGVNVYLGKPFNEDELLRTLQQLIGDKAAATASSVAQMLGEA
ncbi:MULTISPECIES: Hpt domain-containing protein [unclassified Cupriavidus]|uniref:hybrid sensor histidine kinase/response regulator n=1 Tax=unclassified Cupriavidus TaxID=2640874 RepID=UPI001C006629|nr:MULTISPECIES: Hpt domain-containing protein [unclassified Cupriavidus]MCA3192973.1 Hpt domain-containing protein [Cupriavidus sp.]MCA3195825.1 Hpt domain-containing protein [Cupriavidus sp.]MCA3204726.1 Hpt domain-containing protein [Cupriavidus sp.]MCA3206858.1 Hpt domain-containing protein [Cupriavidus sp.]QWE94994.1 Hpt domain-containing protein [Cupriavidus sp. EM10]